MSDNHTHCFLCKTVLSQRDTLKIIYCCDEKVHQYCWFMKIKQNKTKCCVCKQEYSKEIQIKIDEAIERKNNFDRNHINQIFKYIHKRFFGLNK